jgi:MATE family multidrug resistance protein
MTLGLVDSAMVGAVNSILLASSALVNSLIAIPSILAIGLSIGISPLITVSFGARQNHMIKVYLQNGLIVSLLFSLILAVFVHLFGGIVTKLGQDTEVAMYAHPYLILMGWAIIPMSLFLTIKQFSDGVELTKWPMYLSLATIPLNALLNYLLIYGNWGFPRLELVGAGYATLISRTCIMVAMLILISKKALYKEYLDIWYTNWRIRKADLIRILKIGIPTSFQYAMESWAFAFSGIMMGWLGSKALAAHQIALSLASFTFMGAMGISAAGSIKVGAAYGRQNKPEMRSAGYTTLKLSLWYGIFCAVIFVSARKYLPYLFNNESDVVQLASVLLIFAALFQVSDSAQATGVSICRGRQDVFYPTLFVILAYWVIGIPLGYASAFIWNLGPIGIWIGFLSGLSASAILLNWRFFHKL